MVDDETAVQHFQEQKFTLEDVIGSVRVLWFEDVLVLLPDDELALHDQLVGRHRPALFHLGGQV